MSNFQRCFPAARGQPNPLARRGGRAMPHYIKQSTETYDFFLLHKKSASLSPDRELVDFKRTVLGKSLIIEKTVIMNALQRLWKKIFDN